MQHLLRRYVHEPTQQWIELRDGGHYTNHSNTPNCEAGYSADPFDDEQFSIEDIKSGDEIFEDYGCVCTVVVALLLNCMHCMRALRATLLQPNLEALRGDCAASLGHSHSSRFLPVAGCVHTIISHLRTNTHLFLLALR